MRQELRLHHLPRALSRRRSALEMTADLSLLRPPAPNAESGGAARSVDEQEPCPGGGHLDVLGVRHCTCKEHLDLQLRSVNPEFRHLGRGDGLDDVMDMDGLTSGVRPEAVVDLVSVDELAGHRRGPMEEWSEFHGFVHREVGYRSDVALRLHDQCPNSERSDAVLDEPVLSSVDEAARKLPLAT